MEIKIAKEFTDTPGGRTIEEGEFSGEQFRKDLLEPKYNEAISKSENLVIDFDGSFGYAPSFLDEAFGGLVKSRKEKGILENIKIVSNDDVTVERKIAKYVKEAEDEINH